MTEATEKAWLETRAEMLFSEMRAGELPPNKSQYTSQAEWAYNHFARMIRMGYDERRLERVGWKVFVKQTGHDKKLHIEFVAPSKDTRFNLSGWAKSDG